MRASVNRGLVRHRTARFVCLFTAQSVACPCANAGSQAGHADREGLSLWRLVRP